MKNRSNEFYLVWVATILVLLPVLNSCVRLDSNLFNSKRIDSYKLDAYSDTKELPDLDASYNIDDSLVKIFTLNSHSSEGDAKIYAIYTGHQSRIATDTVIMYCHGNKYHMDVYW